MGTTSSSIFTGSSQFSQDFSSVITRAVQMASLPITLLNNDLTNLQDQSSALSALDTKFAALTSAVQGIQDAVGGAAYQATVSDPAKLSVSLGDGAMEGNFTLDVADAGAYATSMTKSWDSNGAHIYWLTMDGGATTLNLNPVDNTAAGVASAINNNYSDRVRAIVVNVGSSDTPDYRISLQAVQLGALQPDILDGSTSLQDKHTDGAIAKYIVNNSGLTVNSTSRTVSLATGITVNLLAKDLGVPVNITVARGTSALSSAFSAFATAYNGAVDEVDKQHGITAGPLAGHTVVNDLSHALSQIASYSTPGVGVGGLANLGLALDKTGHMTFDAFRLMATDLGNSSAVDSFIGTPTSGGFLQMAINTLNNVSDPVTGSLPTTESDVKNRITSTNTRISTKQDQVDQLQTRLKEQMSAADALISAMEQQYSVISGMFQAMQTASQQYR